MSQMPLVKPGEWITIGEKHLLQAVVCQVFSDRSMADIEAVYLDRNRAINVDLVWKDDHWTFRYPEPSGGYADQYPRLQRFVSLLRGPQRLAQKTKRSRVKGRPRRRR